VPGQKILRNLTASARSGIVGKQRETLKGSAQEFKPRSILPNNSDFHWRVKIVKSSNGLAFLLPNHILTAQ
jgi:hypothetical protein